MKDRCSEYSLQRYWVDSVGGEARGAGPAVLDGPGTFVGAGAKQFADASVRGGSNTKPESRFVSQVAQTGSADCSPRGSIRAGKQWIRSESCTDSNTLSWEPQEVVVTYESIGLVQQGEFDV